MSCDPAPTPSCGDPAARLAALWTLIRAGARSPDLRAAARACERPTPAATARAIQLRVQSLPYVDVPTGPCNDLRALCDVLTTGGVCDLRAALAVCLDGLCGLRGELAWLAQLSAPLDHVTSRVGLAGAWRWQETTIAAALGEDPYAALARLGADAHRRLRGS